MKKKILHVVGGMDVGGTETMLMNLYRNIDREKYEFHFISYYGREGFYDREIKKLGGEIIHLSFSKKLGALGSILELRRVIKENNYDVVHTHTLFNCGIGVLAAWLGSAKVRISHAHTVFEEKDGFLKKLYIKSMRKLIEKYSTHYFACSNKAGEFLFGSDILKRDNYIFIPNYVDYKKFMDDSSRDIGRDILQIKKDEIVIGHVGRLIEAKNHVFILKILEVLKSKGLKVKCIFVGDGHLRDEIELKVAEYSLKDEVIITGMVAETKTFLSCMDIFLLPSKYEGFGLVLLEAQSSGLHCIASTAIQDETNLEIGLLEKYDLNLGAEFWAEKILERIKRRRNITSKDIDAAFVKKEYDLDSILKSLDRVYGGEI